jgi:hypothetical protein
MSDSVDIASLPPVVRRFRPQCPGCTPARLSAEGARPCSHYDCPGLPAELRVTCDLCLFDFAAGDGQVKCDHDTCPTALRLRANVPVYRAWVEMIVAEAEGHPL